MHTYPKAVISVKLTIL